MPTLAVYGDSFADTNAYLWTLEQNPSKYLQDKYNNAWPVILSRMLGADLICYAKNGTNRQWSYNQFRESAGYHDYYVIVHTYYNRILSFTDPELMRFGYWRPDHEVFPVEEYRTAFEEYVRVFKDLTVNQIAHVGFNHAYAKLIEDKHIPKHRVMHIFLDQYEDYLNPSVVNTYGLNDGSHNYTANLSHHSFKEIEYLYLNDDAAFKDFIGRDLRPCHLTWLNNGKLAETIQRVFLGEIQGLIDLEKNLADYDHPKIREQIEYLRHFKDHNEI